MVLFIISLLIVLLFISLLVMIALIKELQHMSKQIKYLSSYLEAAYKIKEIKRQIESHL